MWSLKNMKVGARLGVAFGIVVVLMVIIGVTTVSKIQSINSGISASTITLNPCAAG